MDQLKLEVEELEERIAPSFIFAEGSQPDTAGASPSGGQAGTDGPLETSFGPNSTVHPNGSAWTAHSQSSVLENGENK